MTDEELAKIFKDTYSLVPFGSSPDYKWRAVVQRARELLPRMTEAERAVIEKAQSYREWLTRFGFTHLERASLELKVAVEALAAERTPPNPVDELSAAWDHYRRQMYSDKTASDRLERAIVAVKTARGKV